MSPFDIQKPLTKKQKSLEEEKEEILSSYGSKELELIKEILHQSANFATYEPVRVEITTEVGTDGK